MKNNLINTKEQWITFLNNKENGFDVSFIEKAIDAIEWRDGEGIILPSSFKDLDLPDKFFIPSSISSIGSQAFSNALFPEGFIIPSTVLNICENAFEHVGSKRMTGDDLLRALMCSKRGNVCNKMKEFFIVKDYETFINLKTGGMNMMNVVMADDFAISDTTKIISKESLSKKRLPNDLVIPSSVISIEKHAFGWSLIPMNFNIPESVQNIDSKAFEGAKLQEGYKIDNYATWVGLAKGGIRKNQMVMDDIFSFPKGITSIEENVFEDAVLSNGFEIPKTVIDNK